MSDHILFLELNFTSQIFGYPVSILNKALR